MRILHTSDWHLGRSFHGFDLIEAQRRFVDHLTEVVRSEGIDAVLIAGDVYDRAIPSLEAVEVLEHGLAALSRHAKVVISSGNHDSARRLGFAAPLLENANVHLRTRLSDITRPVVLGEGSRRVHVYAIPFLEPYTSAAHLGADGEEAVQRSHGAVLAAAVARIAEHREAQGAHHTVVMSHAWFAGGAASESEVDISMGGIGQASASMLDAFDYAALGHLHKPQAIDDRMRYSGSPLHYSFSEMGSAKSSVIIDMSGDRPVVTDVPVPVFRELHEIRDSLDNLLTSSAYEAYTASFLRIHLTDLPVPQQAMSRLRERFPWVADLQTARVGGVEGPTAETLRTLTELDVCTMFLRDVRGAEPDAWEAQQLQLAIDLGRRGIVDSAVPGNVACEHEDVDGGAA